MKGSLGEGREGGLLSHGSSLSAASLSPTIPCRLKRIITALWVAVEEQGSPHLHIKGTLYCAVNIHYTLYYSLVFQSCNADVFFFFSFFLSSSIYASFEHVSTCYKPRFSLFQTCAYGKLLKQSNPARHKDKDFKG